MAAREFHQAFSATEVSTTSVTAWESVVSFTFTPTNGVDYALLWSFEGARNSQAASLLFRVALDGVAIETASARPRTVVDYPQYMGFLRVQGQGVSVTLTLDILNAAGTDLALGRNGSLVAVALGAGDLYAESLARTEVTSDTLVPLVGVTASADAGDYLLLGMSMLDSTSNVQSMHTGFDFNTVASPSYSNGMGHVSDVRPLMAIWKRTLASAGLLAAQWLGRTNAGILCAFRSNRVLALKLAAFDDNFYAELMAASVGTDATPVRAYTAIGNVTANPHLVIATHQTATANNQYVHAARVVEDGVEIGRGALRTYGSSNTRGNPHGLVRVWTGDVGTRIWGVDRISDGSASMRIMTGSALIALDLGALGKTLAATSAAFVESGGMAGLCSQRRLFSAQAGFVLSGLGAGLGPGRRVRAVGYDAALSGLAAGVRAGRKRPATVGAFSVAGIAAGLLKWPDGVQYRLAAMQVGFAMAGRPAGIRPARRLALASGGFVRADLNASVRRGLKIVSSQGGFEVAGFPVEWGSTHALHPERGAFVLDGPTAGLRYSGQKFWNAVPATAELWAASAEVSETWSLALNIPETWS